MKRTWLWFVALAAITLAAVGCPQETGPTAVQNKTGAIGDQSEPRTVTIPINVVKTDNMFKTRAIREAIVWLSKETVSASGTVIIGQTPGHNYIEWDISMAHSAEDALNESLIIKHVVVPYDDSTADNNAVTLSYGEVKQWLGREVQVGDQLWVGFRAINHNDGFKARMVHHIIVGNPTSTESVSLKYGFDGWYVEGILEGNFSTTRADIYLGANAAATKINTNPVNGHVVKIAANDYKTYFICPVPAASILIGQPYHVQLRYSDVEAASQIEGVSDFKAENIVYASSDADAWNFRTTSAAGATYALAPNRSVMLDTADPTLNWDDMESAAALYKDKDNNSVLQNAVYELRLADSEAGLATVDVKNYRIFSSPGSYFASLEGLQFNKKYFAQVVYSYDIKKAYTVERKVRLSPIVSFTTFDGMTSPVYTFSSGRTIPSSSLLPVPAGLWTDGTVVAGNGNSAPGLALGNLKDISSYETKVYAASELRLDLLLPANISNTVRDVKATLIATDGPVHTESDILIVAFASEGAQLFLVYKAAVYTSNSPAANNGTWTLTSPGGLYIRANGGGPLKYSTQAIFTTQTTPSGPVTGVTGAAMNGYTYTNAMRGTWLDYKPCVFSLTKARITGKVGEVEVSVDVDDSLALPKNNGYRSFLFRSIGSTIHVDNVQYKVIDPTFKRKFF